MPIRHLNLQTARSNPLHMHGCRYEFHCVRPPHTHTNMAVYTLLALKLVRAPVSRRVPGGFHTEQKLSRKNSMLVAFHEASISPRASKSSKFRVAPHDIGITQQKAFESTTRARLEAVDQLMDLLTSEERTLMRSRILLEQPGPGAPKGNAVIVVENLAP